MGYSFLLLFVAAAHSLATESDCSGNDGPGKLFWGTKNLSSWCFLLAIKFLVIL